MMMFFLRAAAFNHDKHLFMVSQPTVVDIKEEH